MNRVIGEWVMGLVVLAVAGAFLLHARNLVAAPDGDGYGVEARFYAAGGVGPGADVRLHGIRVGKVVTARLDPQSYDAVLTLRLAGDIRLPVDSVAAIGGDGLLGGPHVRLEPGRATEMIPAGGKIEKTLNYKSLEERVADIIFLAGGSEVKP